MIQLSINHYNLLILLNVYLAILIHICSISMLDIGFFSTYNDNIFEKKGGVCAYDAEYIYYISV